VNIQGTLSEHSVNIQGTTHCDGSLEPAIGVDGHTASGLASYYSGNIQLLFREHLVNIQGTLREHSGNIQGATHCDGSLEPAIGVDGHTASGIASHYSGNIQ
jgi:hypothetical protein